MHSFSSALSAIEFLVVVEKKHNRCCVKMARNESEKESSINLHQTRLLRTILKKYIFRCSRTRWWQNTMVYCLDESHDLTAHLRTLTCHSCGQPFRIILVSSKLIEFLFWSGNISISMTKNTTKGLNIENSNIHRQARNLLLKRVLHNEAINYSEYPFSTISNIVINRTKQSLYLRMLFEIYFGAILFLLMHEMAHSIGDVIKIKGSFKNERIPGLRCTRWDEEIKADISGMTLLSEYLNHESQKYLNYHDSRVKAKSLSLLSAFTCLECLSMLEILNNSGLIIPLERAATEYKWATHPPSRLRRMYVESGHVSTQKDILTYAEKEIVTSVSRVLTNLLSVTFL